MNRFRFCTEHAALFNEWSRLNRARTPGKWRMDDMEFPEGDPDRAFVEFITEHSDVLLKTVATYYIVEGY